MNPCTQQVKKPSSLHVCKKCSGRFYRKVENNESLQNGFCKTDKASTKMCTRIKVTEQNFPTFLAKLHEQGWLKTYCLSWCLQLKRKICPTVKCKTKCEFCLHFFISRFALSHCNDWSAHWRVWLIVTGKHRSSFKDDCVFDHPITFYRPSPVSYTHLTLPTKRIV